MKKIFEKAIAIMKKICYNREASTGKGLRLGSLNSTNGTVRVE